MIAIANVILDMGAMTSLDMSKNGLLTKEGGEILVKMLKTNSVLKDLNVSQIGWGLSISEEDGPGFAQKLAVGIKDNGALTSLDISDNKLARGAYKGDGWDPNSDASYATDTTGICVCVAPKFFSDALLLQVLPPLPMSFPAWGPYRSSRSAVTRWTAMIAHPSPWRAPW
jgi:hypothetical protein